MLFTSKIDPAVHMWFCKRILVKVLMHSFSIGQSEFCLSKFLRSDTFSFFAEPKTNFVLKWQRKFSSFIRLIYLNLFIFMKIEKAQISTCNQFFEKKKQISYKYRMWKFWNIVFYSYSLSFYFLQNISFFYNFLSFSIDA